MMNLGRIDFKKEDYLKKLIKMASRGMIEVQALTSGLQFFLILGGAEGFLSSAYAGIDASRIEDHGEVTGGAKSTTVIDDTCLLAVFDHLGALLSSALLRRPLVVKVTPKPPKWHDWTEDDAIAVVAAWDRSKVGVYYNHNFEVKYYGLWVDDSKHYYTSGQKQVDFHKEEQTNGCIFVRDDTTPPLPDDALSEAAQHAALTALNGFEPELIKAVQAKIGTKIKNEIGNMRVVKLFSSQK
jgi:hypothetical protein